MDMDMEFERIKIKMYLIITIAISLIGGGIFGSDDQATYLLANLVILVYFVIAIKNHHTLRKVYDDFLLNVEWKNLIAIVIILALCATGMSLISKYIICKIKPEIFLELTNVSSTSTIFSIVCLSINASFIAPIVEEILFRGVILTRLSKRWGFSVGCTISSVLFGLGHLMDFAGAFMVGVVMCVLYQKNKNIMFPIAVHMMNNIRASVLLIVSGSVNMKKDTMLYDSSDLLIGIFLVIATIFYIIKYVKQNWPRENKQIHDV